MIRLAVKVVAMPEMRIVENALRQHPSVHRLLHHNAWKGAAEAAVAFFVRGIPSPVPGWPETSTWAQVKVAFDHLSNDFPAAWRTSTNDDSGSLFTGSAKLGLNDVIEILGEGRSRTVTYVMGSEKKGWRACFGGQGEVARGEVTWRVVMAPETTTFQLETASQAQLPQKAHTKLEEPHHKLVTTKLLLELLVAVIAVIGAIFALMTQLLK